MSKGEILLDGVVIQSKFFVFGHNFNRFFWNQVSLESKGSAAEKAFSWSYPCKNLRQVSPLRTTGFSVLGVLAVNLTLNIAVFNEANKHTLFISCCIQVKIMLA